MLYPKLSKSSQMKKLLVVVLTFILCLRIVECQTVISDKSEVSGTWTKANSPYIINGEAIVPASLTLTMEPGVVVKFKTGNNFYIGNGINVGFLHVKGKLLANGSVNDSIVFTRDASVDNWGAIVFESTSANSALSYCRIEFANTLQNGAYWYSYFYGAITSNSKTTISNCSIINNNTTGIQCASSSIIKDCKISNNNGNGILFKSYTSTISAINPVIINNKITLNENSGIYDETPGTKKLIGNLIVRNKQDGLMISRNTDYFVTNTTICKNKTGIFYSGVPYNNAPINITNSVIFGNITNVSDALIKIYYCVVEGDRLKSPGIDLGFNYYTTDPPFSDTINFVSTNNSILRDNGTPDTTGLFIPGVDINKNNRIFNGRIDIGPIESDNEYLRIDNLFNNKAVQQSKNFTIEWNGTPLNYKLEYSTDKGATWININQSVSAKSYVWSVPNSLSNNCKLKISSATNVALFDTVSFRITAENIIANKESVWGTWTKANSPYIVEGEATVPQGKVLNIEPGVIVKFKTGSDFTPTSGFNASLLKVYGKLLANGTKNDTIVFTRNSSYGNWGTIMISESSDTSKFYYTKVEYGNIYSTGSGEGWYFTGALSSYKSNLIISKSRISNNKSIGVNSWQSFTRIDSCNFTLNSIGIYYYFGNGGVSNNRISNCNTGVSSRSTIPVLKNSVYNNQTGLYLVQSGIIEGNEINNNKLGIWGYASGNVIRNNSVYNNETGMNFNGSGSPKIINNIIYKNKVGFSLYNQWNTDVSFNTIVKNEIPFINNSSETSFQGNIVYFNKKSFNYENVFSIKHSLLEESSLNSDIVDPYENILAKDPLFADTLNNIFTLKQFSPAINGGIVDTTGLLLPKTDHANKPRVSNGRIDIGAFEYQQTGEYIQLFYPYNHEYFVSNTIDSITWLSSSTITTIDISYSINAGKSWSVLAANLPNNGKYLWKTPELISDSCLLRVVKHGDPQIFDLSRHVFTISPNIIPDKKQIYGVFKKQYSPFTILGVAIVPKDSVLIIESGTSVKLKKGTPSFGEIKDAGNFSVRGKLFAFGDNSDKILFTRIGQEGNWGNITLEKGAAKSFFKHCIVEYASGSGAINVINDSVRIELCIVRNSSQNGVYIGSQIKDAIVINTLIYNNSESGIKGYETTVINSTLAYNGNYGIHGNHYIKNSIFFGNDIGIYNPYPYNQCILEYSLTQDKAPGANIQNGDGNIFDFYPQFADSAAYDFHLLSNSPCINAGNPADSYSQEPLPNGGRIDMGAYGNTPEATSFTAIPRFDSVSKNKISIFGGDTITIQGKYFLPARGTGYVAVGDSIVKTYTMWSDNIIKFIAPAQRAGSYNLKVNAGNGLQNSLNSYFNYYNVQLKSIDPLYGKIAGGDTITIKGNYLSNGIRGVTLFLDASPGSKVISWTDNQVKVIVPGHSEGLADLIFKQSATISDTIKKAFLYTSKAVNPVCGNVSGTWPYPNIYILTCPVTIPAGQKLVIEPGVIVYAKISESGILPKITVTGEFSAAGTNSRNILFSVIPGIPGSWDGIIAGSTSKIKSSIIEYATNGITVGSSLVTIDSCIIRNNSLNGLYYDGDEKGAGGTITNSIIESNGNSGIYCLAGCSSSGGGASPGISYNLISNNKQNGIRLSAYGSVPSSGTATKTASASPKIFRNTIIGNLNFAISGVAEGTSSPSYQGILMKRYANVIPEIKYNLIINNHGIINFNQGFEYSQATANIINNTMYENSSVAIVSNAEVNIMNSIMRGLSNQNIQATGKLIINHSNTIPVYQGTGNTSVDPQFIDLLNSNFNLKPTSPCINSGNPDTDGDGVDYKTDADDQDGDCTRKDIGAFPYIYKPIKPTLASPANNATEIPVSETLVWRKATYAKQYRINVSTSDSFSSPVINKLVSDTALVPAGLNYTTSFFWRVKAINIADSSDWSDTWKFTTLTPVLNATPTGITIGRLSGSTGTLTVESNTTWSASDNQSWLSLTPAGGSNNGTITLTATSTNTSTSARSATVTISGAGVTPKTIAITQEATVLTVSQSSLTIGAPPNSTKTFTITSNISWSVSSSQTWLTVNNSSGTGNATITLTAAANPSTATRSATITISGSGVSSKTISVTQEASLPSLNVSASALTILAAANSIISFEITSNIGWTVLSNKAWLRVSNVSGSGNSPITLTAEKNPVPETRTAIVTISGTGVSAKSIEITQEGTPVGIEELTEKDLILYPNPTNGILYFMTELTDVQISIYDMNGQHMSDYLFVENEINVSNLPNGSYIIIIKDKTGSISRKFIKQ